ncbi:partial anaerobic dimethyl sulfoxide reductase subunit B (DMSO reductase iron- sulfur subunit), partial [Anaerolineales bacterium]
MQYAFYYDQSRCMGCETCLVACKDWNGVKPGPAKWRRITITEDGTFPALTVFNLIMSCNHCEEPVCVEVCPTEAIFKREDGIVIVNRSVCENNLECV